MNNTPDEIVDSIVQYVTEPANLTKLLQTCKRISHIVDHSNIWLYLCQHHLFAVVIIKTQSENHLSWKENFKLIDTIAIKSQEFQINDQVWNLVQIRGNGKCYISLYGYHSPDYNVIFNSVTYHMYDINVGSFWRIIDFSIYEIYILLITSDNHIYSYNSSYSKLSFVDLRLTNQDKVIKIHNADIGSFILVKSKIGNNKLYYLAYDNNNIWTPVLLSIWKTHSIVDFSICDGVILAQTIDNQIIEFTLSNQMPKIIKMQLLPGDVIIKIKNISVANYITLRDYSNFIIIKNNTGNNKVYVWGYANKLSKLNISNTYNIVDVEESDFNTIAFVTDHGHRVLVEMSDIVAEIHD